MIERAVLGSVLIGDMCPSALMLESRHFSDPLCRRLFEALQEMERAGKAIDLAAVCMEYEKLDAGELVAILEEHCVSVVIAEQHCERLRENGRRQALEAMLIRAQSALRDGADSMVQAEALRKGIEILMKQDMPAAAAGQTMLELIVKVLDEMSNPHKQETAIATGIEKIDECLCGGFRPGDLGVIAALTSVGKSAMLAFMMRNAARQGKRILLISCEMSDEQNAERYMAAISGVPLQQIMQREALTEKQSMQMSDGMALYPPENIRVICGGTQTVSTVRREAMRMRMSGGLDLIIVDYLQRMHSDRAGNSRAEDVGSIASGLKSLAADLNVPVLTAAQFNREAARARSEAMGNAQAGIPALHQLRDSSQIEDEANEVIILDEPLRESGTRVRRINAHVSKNRCGRLGAVQLLFDAQTMRYYPADADGESAQAG